jgi:hypothetical protein
MSRGEYARLTQAVDAEALVECVAKAIKAQCYLGSASWQNWSPDARTAIGAIIQASGLTKDDRVFMLGVLVEREEFERERDGEAGAEACAKLRSLLLALHRVVEGGR